MRKFIQFFVIFSAVFAMLTICALADSSSSTSRDSTSLLSETISSPPQLLDGSLPISTSVVTSFDNALIRCGLYYGSDVLLSANLANEVGSGYLLGWYDSDDIFHTVGYTAHEKITVAKDSTIYMHSGKYYDSIPPSGSMTIGSYHVQLDESYPSYDDAYAAATEYSSAFPAYINGEWKVRVGNYKTSDGAASSGVTGDVVGSSKSCYTLLVTATGEIIFEFDMSSDIYLGILPTGDDSPVTWFKNVIYPGGFEYKRMKGDYLTVVNVLKSGDYIRGVLPEEMGTTWPMEAMKAQAVCAASYAFSNLGRHKSLGFDICNTTCCQVYRGLKNANADSDAACAEVAGLGLYYGDKICSTVYHSSNGGFTEDSINVWSNDFPYLKAVPDEYEDLSRAIHGRWSYSYTGEELKWLLNEKGYSIGSVTNVYVSEYTPAGNVLTVCFEDKNGKKLTFSKEKARTIFYSATLGKYAHSQRYTISTDAPEYISLYVNDSDGLVKSDGSLYVLGADGVKTQLPSGSTLHVLTGSGQTTLSPPSSNSNKKNVFYITGTGWGHNVGMSQWGARGRAEAGWTFDEILTYYFTGTSVQPIY